MTQEKDALTEATDAARKVLDHDWVVDDSGVCGLQARDLRTLLSAIDSHREAFRLIRERIKDNQQPLFIAADIDQIISEVGGEWEEER